ncbi:MAG: threonine--tRNA ligase, partial [bacterium]|nr:threonine--tRNA ligase [bacterium]
MQPKDDKLFILRHSLSHILACAVLEMFPKANLGVGPVIENGFFYDFLLPRPFTPEDLKKLEKRMRELIKQKLPFEKREMSISDAKKFFKDLGQTFKVELLEDIEKHGTTEYDQIEENEQRLPAGKAKGEKQKISSVSVYQTGKFTDLCRGPHVKNTSEIPTDCFKLDKTSGAYWRGDQKNPQMQRAYGLAFENKTELEKYLKLMEEVEKRDHKKLGPALELFMFHHTAPGMPYWLPKGVVIYNELINFWRMEHQKRGYQEIVSPLLNKKELYVTSGHYEHYWENMFVSKTTEDEEYGVKAMNCPNAHIVYSSKARSYRDLPLRLGDTDTL